MRLNFKKIEIHNFMSFADEVFDFPTEPGLNLICGKNNDIPNATNGSGKSTLINSIVFSLFGQTKDQIKNENIHNKFIKGKDTRVVTYFSVDNESYKIASGFNNSGKPYCELHKLENGKYVSITKSTIAETRKFLTEQIICCDMSIFLRTVLLSSDQNYNFYKLKKNDKKEFIEKLFDISVFGDMYNLIHKDILNYDKQIIAKQNKLIVLNKAHDDYNTKICAFNESKETKLKDLNEKLKSASENYNILKTQNVSINTQLLNKYEKALDILSDKIESLNSKNYSIKSDISKLELATHKLELDKQQKQLELDKHSIIIQKLCSNCQKKFKDHYNIATYESDINSINIKITKIKIVIKNKQDLISANSIEIEKNSEKVKILNQKIQELTSTANKISKELITEEQKIINIQQNLDSLINDENPYLSLLKSNNNEIFTETNELNEITQKYSYLKISENIVSQDTIRKFIIKDLVSLLNNKIKHYLTKFGAKYSVVFDPDMNYEFKTDVGTYEYDSFSSGERARIMIATCFAFRDFMYIRNNISSNILILDEFIDGAIDTLAIESILEILKSFSVTWKQNIWIVSHRKEINNDAFKRILQIEKTNNISKICYLDGFNK